MGYLKAGGQDVDKLTLPSDPEYFVFMKRRASYGDKLATQAAAVKVDVQGSAQVAVDSAASVRMAICRLVTGWNLTDENDQPLPVTLENLDRLDPDDGAFLADEANRRLGERPAEQQVPFKNGSGRLSTATRSRTQK